MAKKAKKSKKSGSSSSASAATSSSSKAMAASVSGGKMVLRVRTNESLRRSPRQSLVTSEKEKKPRSATKLKGKLKKKNVKLDPKMPKKPPTAFFFFLEDFRKEFQVQNPDVKSMRDIGKACGEKWKTMTYEEKVKYYDIATQKRAEFDRSMAEYIKRKESGEYEESEDDSEYNE